MKCYSFIILIHLSVYSCFSQPGYSRMYDFDLAASFHNVILVDDTLIIAGTAMDEESNQWGALFVKMDTLGNVLDYNLYLDTLGSHIAIQKSYPLIKTSNNHYMMMGDLLNRPSDYLLTLDTNGETIAFWEYPYESNIRTSHPWKLLEVNDGYLIFSTKQVESFKSHVFVTKINFEGEIIWEERYGDTENFGSLLGSVWKQDDNTIIIGATKTTTQIARPPPNTFYCPQNWIFAIDSLGTMKWEWRGEPCNNGANIKGLQPTPDGGWIYVTSRLQVYDQWTLGYAPVIMKRDSEFNLVWKRQLVDSYSMGNNEVIDIKPSIEGTWVGVGRWVLPEPYAGWSEGHIYTPACLYKVTDDGDSLWIRCDTVQLESGNHTLYHKYGGLVTLSSGSTIAVGDFREQGGGQGGQGKSWAWVVKVDKDGCMEELCSITGIKDLAEKKTIHIFPNPSKNLVQINSNLSDYSMRLLSIEGRVLKKWTDLFGDSSINISEIERGVYFLEFRSKGKKWMKKIVKI